MEFRLVPVDPSVLERPITRGRGRWQEIIQAFLASDSPVSRVEVPGGYPSMQQALLMACQHLRAPVRVVRRRCELYLVRSEPE